MAEIPGLATAWDSVLERTSPAMLKTVVTFGLHELFYWGSYVPFFVMDQIPALRRWKIQPDVVNTGVTQWKCAKLIIMNHLAVVLPLVFLSHLFEGAGSLQADAELPTLATIALQVLVCFVIEDFLFYWGHRALHTRLLYRLVHHVHHEFSAPLGLAAEYAHPVEVIFLGMATVVGPLLVNAHIITTWVYLFLRCLQTVECHSGYDFPWSLNRWFPLYGGADFHDHHHKHYSGNYASIFTWTDAVHGTDEAYRKWKAEQRRQLSKADDVAADAAVSAKQATPSEIDSADEREAKVPNSAIDARSSNVKTTQMAT
eukprot:CAMPEP_0185839752 /NCGR_PEP_ID=MMETSP1353-20130828/15097_1 /TAXON_ID=1077150 /ORGANISM="Erythrolobus australicus, Strain CCMP3124" /LENGTH=313 /DNA_ID=CAMNT_0028538967 /DNA_START=42 /DNA_END=983 /DNA_ORIENTATION=+